MDETEQIEEDEKWYRGPMKIVLGLFLLLLIIMMTVPYYSIKLDPEPKYIPEIDEVAYSITAENHTDIKSRQEYLTLLRPYDPELKRVADMIVNKGCESNKICQAKAMFYFVQQKFNYVSDPTSFEYVKSAKESLIVQGGDCDDASVLLANLLEAVGIRTRFVFIPGHVYVEGKVPDAPRKYGEWIAMDATCTYCEFREIPWQNIDSAMVIVS